MQRVPCAPHARAILNMSRSYSDGNLYVANVICIRCRAVLMTIVCIFLLT